MNLRDDQIAVPPGLPQKRPLCSARHEAPDLGHGVDRISIRSGRLARLPEICSGRRLRYGTRTGSHRPPALFSGCPPAWCRHSIGYAIKKNLPERVDFVKRFFVPALFFHSPIFVSAPPLLRINWHEKGASLRTLPKSRLGDLRQRMPLS